MLKIQFNYLHDHRDKFEIEVQGRFPNYVVGTLYRTGPNAYKLARDHDNGGIMSVSHW